MTYDKEEYYDLLDCWENLPAKIPLSAIRNAKWFIKLLPEHIGKLSLSRQLTGQIILDLYKRESSGKVTDFLLLFYGNCIFYSLFKDGEMTDISNHLNFESESIKEIIEIIKNKY